MVRLPLIINGQRLKTLEGLRENFNLTELLERFRGGQLRAWLNCWDFDSELEQVEALSPDLPKQELLEALCRIFGVEGEAKEQALAAFKEEQEKREEETKRRKKQQEAEERAKISVAKPLTLDEIEFDWQEGITLNKESLYDINVGEDRFFALSDYNYERISIYSYDGIHWEPSSSCINSTIRQAVRLNPAILQQKIVICITTWNSVPKRRKPERSRKLLLHAQRPALYAPVPGVSPVPEKGAAPTAMDAAWCKEANPSRFGFRLMSNPVPSFGFRDKVMPDVEKHNLETCMCISPSGKSLRSHLHRQIV